MLVKIKAEFVKGDKVGPLILRRLSNKSGNEDFPSSPVVQTPCF